MSPSKGVALLRRTLHPFFLLFIFEFSRRTLLFYGSPMRFYQTEGRWNLSHDDFWLFVIANGDQTGVAFHPTHYKSNVWVSRLVKSALHWCKQTKESRQLGCLFSIFPDENLSHHKAAKWNEWIPSQKPRSRMGMGDEMQEQVEVDE